MQPEHGGLRMVWRLFWNADEQRLRLGFRLAIFGVALLAVFMLVRFLVLGSSLESITAVFMLQMALVLTVSSIQVRAVDRRPLSELGLTPRSGYLLDLVFGVVLGAACMSAIAAVEIALGWGAYTRRHDDGIELLSSASSYGSVILIFAAVAIIEEVIFRGYPLHNLCGGLRVPGAPRGFTAAIATLLTSIAFGVAHAGNPHVSGMAVAFIAFGGIFLATGLLFSGDLAIPIGAHFGWNFFQNFFGMQVSGQQFESASFFLREELGPDMMTGGTFGPEAGLEGLLGMVLGTILTLSWLRVRSGRLRLHRRFGEAEDREVDDEPRS